MKTIIKLLVVVAVCNAVLRAGSAALKYYQLRDAAEQAVLFGATLDPEQLQTQIVEQARALDIPLPAENVSVTRDGLRTRAQASYTEGVELFPRYVYPFPFSFAVEGVAVTMVPTDPVRR